MNRIKYYRKRSGMNQQRLADLMRVSRSTVAMWETNKNQPDADTLCSLSKIFNVSLDELIESPVTTIKQYNMVNSINESPNSSVTVSEELTVQEKELVTIYRSLTIEQQYRLLQTIFEMRK